MFRSIAKPMNLEKSKELIIWYGGTRRISKWSLMSRNTEYSINDRSNYDRNWLIKKSHASHGFQIFHQSFMDV